MRYDKITEVNKNIDCIQEVQKFNPNHDNLGRFSSGGGGGAMAYRRTNGGPVNEDVGYAMFADNEGRVENYGDNLYQVDTSGLRDINEVKEDIAEAMNEAIEDGVFPDLEGSTGEEIAELFNPPDIVDDAGAWDRPDIIAYLYDTTNILDGVGFKTQDGAIVLDESLIERAEEQ